MGVNRRMPPSERYAHLAGAIQCPRERPVDRSAREIDRVLNRLMDGPMSSAAFEHDAEPLNRQRVANIVDTLRKRGLNISTGRMRRDPVSGRTLPGVFTLIGV